MKSITSLICFTLLCQCSNTNDLRPTDWSATASAMRSEIISKMQRDCVRESLGIFLKTDQSIRGENIGIGVSPELFEMLKRKNEFHFTFVPPMSIRNTKNRFYDPNGRMTVIVCVEVNEKIKSADLAVWITPLWSPTGPIVYRRLFLFKLCGSRVQLVSDMSIHSE